MCMSSVAQDIRNNAGLGVFMSIAKNCRKRLYKAAKSCCFYLFLLKGGTYVGV